MARGVVKTSRPIFSLVLGLAAALVVLAVHLGGLDKRVELQVLDLRFRHFSAAAEPEKIVHIDIDDRSLDELGRWPWPRQQLAGIIDELQECGARAIVLDIIMPEPQKVRYVSAAGEIYRSGSEVIGEAPPVPVFDDAILAEAIAGHANVFLPMHIDLARQQKSALQVRLEELLGKDVSLTAEVAAASLDQEQKEINAVFRSARRNVIESRVRAAYSGRGKVDFLDVLAEVLPGLPAGAVTREQEEMVEKAYLRHRAIRALDHFALPKKHVGGYTPRWGKAVPPLVTLAQATSLSGFVTVIPDADGMVRRIPLIGHGGRDAGGRPITFPQFAMAIAAHELHRRQASELSRSDGLSSIAAITGSAEFVEIRCGDAKRRIPVDSEGFMLINWLRGSEVGADKPSIKHIPVTAVANIRNRKRERERMKVLAHAYRVELLKMGRGEITDKELKDLYWEKYLPLVEPFDQAYKQRVAAQRQLQKALLYQPSKVPDSALMEKLQKKEAEIESQLYTIVEKLVRGLRKPQHMAAFLDDNAEAKVRFGETLEVLDSLTDKDEIKLIDAHIGELTEELRSIVAGKICMIGSTATGAADFVPTPIGPRTPGVVVHSNILNTILSGSFLGQSPVVVNILVILAVGAAVSLIAAMRPVLQAAPAAAGLAVAYAAFNFFVVFGLWHVWLIAVAPLAAIFASFLVVTAYRQLTEERAKKHIRGLFAHAMSPALVDRLLEDPSLAELGGQKRELSCMFSDLGGFTSLSESLGPRETVRLLNRYFDRAADVIQDRCGGYLNKFLGDGIFAFFGAPVLQSDHARRAIEAGVECQAEIIDLNRTLAAEGGRDIRLSVRIGITTGEAMVGNCGSTQRMDYTAIGDCVNLASRLEQANKFFGTRILVDENAWRAADLADVPARLLGKVLVAGLTEPVNVWEVLAAADGVTPELSKALGDFAQAVELLAERKFGQAAEMFQRLQELMPDDKPTQLYLEACRQYVAQPPDEDWPGHVFDVSH